ncbi:MAG: DUF4301 family protein [Bacteroidota bacterium]|nr:DUF4301 family protein [Bacteroidota bacterium]
MFTKKDIKFLKDKDIDPNRLKKQVVEIKAGKKYLNVNRPATAEDGVFVPTEDEINDFVKLYEDKTPHLKVTKFVPASGAATRMFKRLAYLRDHYKGNMEEFIEVSSGKDFYSLKKTFENLEKFAFYPELFKRFFRRGQNLERILRKNEYNKVARMILSKRGLNYRNIPKGLVLFHKYPGHARTAFEEHLVEGKMYCLSKDNEIYIHMTIQDKFKSMFEKRFKHAMKHFFDAKDVKFNLEFSEQSESTSSIALTDKNKLLRDKDNRPVLRPGGHGALIYNLNSIDSDMIFIKNIDNVAPDTIKHETVRHKKFIGGVLFHYRNEIFGILKKLNKKTLPSEKEWKKILDFVENKLHYACSESDKAKAVAELKLYLNRPIRVCGMVPNSSEPGGGPFWVNEKKGRQSLQIVEKNQINLDDEKKVEMFESSTHFNPVDIVCSTRDYKGKKFNLLNYRDDKSGMVIEKSHEGKPIKSYEMPGLWNGGMGKWITIFVEVPSITFNPVKELNDLLRMEHQTAK